MRVNIPDQHNGMVMVFFHGIKEIGINLNKMNSIGPLFYLKHPSPYHTLDYISVQPLNEYGGWDFGEIEDILDFVVTNCASWGGDTNRINFVGHSLGGQAIWKAWKDLSSDIASFTAISPIRCPSLYTDDIANSGVDGCAFHARLDLVTRGSSETEHIAREVNAIAPGTISLTLWNGTSHATVNKVFKNPAWNDWIRRASK